MLTVTRLVAGYGVHDVLRGVSLAADKGEVLALIGHNGAGKSTLLRALFGAVRVRGGSVTLRERDITSTPTEQRLRDGIGYVPQIRNVFSHLSVRDNLELGGYILRTRSAMARAQQRAFAMFPWLKDRIRDQAGTLSGGQRQALAVAMCMMRTPSVLLLDEPCLGLAPPAAAVVLRQLRTFAVQEGACCIIVEQRVKAVLEIADRVCVLSQGNVSFAGRPSDLANESIWRNLYLGQPIDADAQ